MHHSDQYSVKYVDDVALHEIDLLLFLSPLLRTVLCLPEGTQDLDEDGSEHGPYWTRELPVGSPGAWCGTQTYQPPQAGPGHGVRRLQRVCHHLWPCGK